jgi:hypothetical protein
MNGLYRLRTMDFSVRLAAVLFMALLGYAYVFAFLMVRDWAGLTPAQVSATYAPQVPVRVEALPDETRSSTQPLDLGEMPGETHHVDTGLLIQDSHIHIMIYAIVAALQTLLVLGLEWSPTLRSTVIVAAFGSGGLDFSGQWLMKAGLPGFAWLTILSGWLMAAVYVAVLLGVLRAATSTDI